jgi:hypothetical protein
MGPIGAGKSTQAELLSQALGQPRCPYDEVKYKYTLMLHKFLDAGAFRVVFSGSRAGFSNRSIVDTM